MLSKRIVAQVFLVGLAVALPAPQVSTANDGQPQQSTAAPAASTGYVSQMSDGQPQAPSATMGTSMGAGQSQASGTAAGSATGTASVFGPDSQISAEVQPSTSGYRVEVYESGYTSATYHGPYSGTRKSSHPLISPSPQ